jgi:hypothetical protein
MNRKLLLGAAAGVAAVALAVGGTTYSAFSDFGDINNNTVGAGFLKLDLGQNGSGNAALNWGQLAPGNIHATRTIWVASNDGQSVPDANLSLTFHNLADQENGCASNGEQAADPTCNTANDPGELSKVLTFQTQYYPDVLDPAACQAAAGSYHQPYSSVFASDQPGDLYQYASGTGTKYTLKNAAGTGPLVLKPGQGVCIGIDSYWSHDDAAHHNSASAPVDNAAQGDSLTFDVHFDLTQV